MVKSLALRDRIISAAVGAAIASVIVPAEARAPASLGLAGQFNLFPYNTSYNRNSAQLGRFGAALRTTNLSDIPVTEYVGRNSLGEMFGGRFLSSASGSTRRSHTSSRGLATDLTSSRGGRRVSGTVLTYSGAGSQSTGSSSFDLAAARLSRQAGSGSVGVASDDADGGLYYTSASQAAAAGALGTGRSGSSNDSNSWSSGTSGGSSSTMSGNHGGTTFTVSGSGVSSGSGVASAAFSGSSFGASGFGLSSALGGGGGSPSSHNTTRNVTLAGLNGSVVTPGNGSGGSGSNGVGTSGAATGSTLFPGTTPVGSIAPAPVPEPGIVVTTLSLLGMTGFGVLRGRRRRA